jgi:hypothetical protein
MSSRCPSQFGAFAWFSGATFVPVTVGGATGWGGDEGRGVSGSWRAREISGFLAGLL